MFAQDRWLVPVHSGQSYLDKPPLLYWLVMVSYHVFGTHVWSARLVTILSAWLTIAVVFWWGRRTVGVAAGFAGAMILALSGDFLYRAPMLTMNSPLALFVTLALAAGHIAICKGGFHWRWWLLSAVACGAGVMTKGPVACILIVGPMLLWPWADRTCGSPGVRRWSAYLGVVLLVAGPWFVAVALREPEFLTYFFWKHHALRFAVPFDHAGPMWTYLPQIFLGLFPWTLLLVGMVVLRARPAIDEKKDTPLSFRPALIAAVWGVTFFSLAGSKRPVYLLPIEPPLALALGIILARNKAGLSRYLSMKPWGLAIAIATGLVLLVGTLFFMPAYTERFSIATLVHLAKKADLTADIPVCCYGHGYDSVSFYLDRDDVMTIRPEGLDVFLKTLPTLTPSLVFMPIGREGDRFLEALPPTFCFRLLGTNALARVGVVSEIKE